MNLHEIYLAAQLAKNDNVNLSDYYTKSQTDGLISEKVDKADGMGLSQNSFTDAEKSKLSDLENYDDTEIKSDLAEVNSALNGKVDKVSGKGLSTNDFTNEAKSKLDSLENYDDTYIKEQIDDITEQIFGRGINIPANSDLNSYTEAGVYYSAASSVSTTLANTPYKTGGFRLEVCNISAKSNVTQRLYPNSSTLGCFFMRVFTSGSDNSFGPWVKYQGEAVTTS